MEQRADLMYSSKLPAITNRFGFRQRPRIPRVMEGMGELNVHNSNGSTRTVVFFKNGDRYFQGHQVLLTQRRYRSFDSLLTELTRVTKLPHGVRFVFTPSSGRRVSSLDQFEDGKSYVCSSFGKLRRIKYGFTDARKGENFDKTPVRKELMTRNIDNIRLKPLNYRPDALKEDKTRSVSVSKAPFIKPRLITVIRNGYKPRRVVKVLLNRRTAQNFEQVLDDVTSAVGVIGGSGVRKLYTIEGKRVQGLSDLLNQEAEGVFIAVGDEKFHSSDLQDILKELNVIPSVNVSSNEGKHHKTHKKVPKQDGDKETSHKAKPAALLKIDEKNDANSITNSKPSVTDDTSNTESHKNLPANHSNRKIKPVKLPLITETEHQKNMDKNDSEKPHYKNKKQEHVLPPIDVNNNDQHDATSNSVKTNFSEVDNEKHTSKPKTVSNVKKEKKPIENIKELFEIGKKLGDGNFAIVRECVHKMTNEKFALKIIDRKKMKGKDKMLDNEIEIMKRCNHQNIVKLFDDYHGVTEIYLVMELVSGGDFFDAISTAVKFSEPEAANYVHDICSSLHYLHKRKIVHRDLKPENLLVCAGPTGKKVLKLADFGLAMEVREPIYTVCGTPTYVAPEILRESGYGLRVDMWAAGVITYIMLCGFPPFRSAKRRQSELFDLIQSGTFEYLSPYWDDVSNEARDLVSNLLVVDIPKRYSADQALNHKWVTGRISESRGTVVFDDELPPSRDKAMSKFKTAAISIQSVQRLKMLASDFSDNRGEKLLTHVK